MVTDSQKFRNLAWNIGLFFLVIGAFLIIATLTLSNGPMSAEEYFLGGSFFIGLLIGKKWPIWGGLISLILPVYVSISSVVWIIEMYLENEPAGGLYFVLILHLIMLTPGVLYLLSAHYKMKENKMVSN